MKKNLLYISALMIGAIALQSCDDNWVNPPMDVPHFPEGVEANTTIAELKTKYWQTSDNYGTQIGLNENGDSIYIQGTVVSSDKSGNIYKSLVLQDESGAITIGINQADLYEEYPMGFGVAVNITGLTIGRYNGLVQLGKLEGTGVNRIELADFAPHAFIDLEAGKLDTIPTTIADIKGFKSDEDKIKWQSRLVRLDSVRFVEAGQPFTNGSTTSRNVTDKDGNRLTVYNSSYSDFAYDKLPKGEGTVVGILSAYKTTWQLLLIDAESCFDFSGEGENPDDPSGEALTLLDEKFATEIPYTWSQVNIAGNKDWYWREFSGEGYANVSGYNGTAPFDQWLVSPCVDLNKVEEKVLSFQSQVNGYGSTTTKFEVYIMTAADTQGTNTQLTPTLPTAPASGYSGWVASGNIDLSALSGKVYVGFRYAATADENYATWCIKDVLLGKKASDVPVTPDTPDTPSDGLKFLVDSDAGWTYEVTKNPNSLEYVWSYSTQYGIKASAYVGGKNNEAEAWAISPEIDLTAATGATMNFEHALNFLNSAPLASHCNVYARVAGSTEWTAVTVPTWPDGKSWTFVNSGSVDLNAFKGQKIQLGFKYNSTAAVGPTWEIKNLTIVPVTK